MKNFVRCALVVTAFVCLYIFIGVERGVAPEPKQDTPRQLSVVYESQLTTTEGVVTYYVAEIYNPKWGSIGSVVAPEKMLPSEMALAIGAEIAINGDFFGYRNNGLIVRGGHILLDKPERDGMGFTRDGRMFVYEEKQTSAQDIVDMGIVNSFSFGPILIQNGEIKEGVDEYYEVDADKSINGRHPRTAVCQTIDSVTMLIVVDGRSSHSAGLDLLPLAELLKGLGCHVAYNLDGGGSSVMVHNGIVVNKPSDSSVERRVSDILYILP